VIRSTKAKLFPIVRPHQDSVGRLNKQPDIPVASLGDAAQVDLPPVLYWGETSPSHVLIGVQF
jgi:hypothetical protein